MESKCDTPYNFNSVHFVMSAPSISDLPEDTGAEIAFIGRSNAGKSSCLNALCSRKTLAKTSRTPGRTRLINLFELEPGKRFVDLPGYGYAKVSKQEKATWDRSLEEYLQKRESLKGLVLLMDIRNPLKEGDRQMIDWSLAAGIPLQILLTKADKLPRGQRKKAVDETAAALREFGPGDMRLFAFSAVDQSIGMDAFKLNLTAWFDNTPAREGNDGGEETEE